MNKLLIIQVLFLLTTIFAKGQQLTVLYPIGITNGVINTTDTLDALIKKGERFELKSVSIEVDTVYNHALGERIPQFRINCDEKPIILFKSHDFSKSDIPGVFLDFKFLEPDSSIKFSINNNQFLIKASGEVIDKGSYKIINNYRLVLDWTDFKVRMEVEILKVPQAHISSKDFIEAPKIIWIGDLDNDNIPDLILEESTHYAQIKRGLYLSSSLMEEKYPRTILIEGSFD